jgi:hypothetical protein
VIALFRVSLVLRAGRCRPCRTASGAGSCCRGRRAAGHADERTGERQPALKIETAGKHPTQPTKYNWDDKIISYPTEDELPQLLCVFLGLLPSVEFRNHGPQHNKSMKIENQGKHLYLTMAEGSERKAAVQLDAGRSTRVATLVARAFQAVNDDIDWNAARDILTRLAAPMVTARSEGGQSRRT